jgi:hypothetical protein
VAEKGGRSHGTVGGIDPIPAEGGGGGRVDGLFPEIGTGAVDELWPAGRSNTLAEALAGGGAGAGGIGDGATSGGETAPVLSCVLDHSTAGRSDAAGAPSSEFWGEDSSIGYRSMARQYG